MTKTYIVQVRVAAPAAFTRREVSASVASLLDAGWNAAKDACENPKYGGPARADSKLQIGRVSTVPEPRKKKV